MASFKVLEKAMTQEMKDENVSGAAPTGPMNSNMATYDQAIMDAKAKLRGLLEQYPEIDYGAKYMELQSAVESQPVPEHPLDSAGEALTGVAYAFGSPDKAPAIMNQKIGRHEQMTDKRTQESLKLKESLLQKSIEQEEKKGNFKMALKQADALDDLKRADEDRTRALNLKDWETKQKTKTIDAQKLLRQRVEGLSKSLSLDDRMTLEAFKIAGQLLEERMEQRNLLGMPMEDIPTSQLISDIIPEVQRIMMLMKQGKDVKPKQPETPPALTPEVKESPYAAALRRRREMNAKGK